MNKQSITIFIRELNSLLNYADKIYSAYIENGKKFVFSKVLFDVNDEIYHLIKSNIVMCPEERKQDAYDLIFHIDVWRTIWLDEVEQKNPSWSDEFAFPNEIKFPKKSVERLLSSRNKFV